jgi:predicted dithiol-disulfide oxidoreductase (DUF899 family)
MRHPNPKARPEKRRARWIFRRSYHQPGGIDKDYVFEGPDGESSLLDLFEDRRQLILYHFMFAPGVEGWPTAGCPGCSMFVD